VIVTQSPRRTEVRSVPNSLKDIVSMVSSGSSLGVGGWVLGCCFVVVVVVVNNVFNKWTMQTLYIFNFFYKDMFIIDMLFLIVIREI
jgi:hypothetical protein